MTGKSESTEGKAQPRDAALSWDVPPEMDWDTQSRSAAASRAAFLDVSAGHIDAICQQLLEAEGVQNAKIWSSLVARLARDASGFISPGMLHSSIEKDLRGVIKVKKVVLPPTAAAAVVELPQAAGSCAVDGVVCHKNVAHKRMRTLIQNPRILTLSGALEEDPSQELSSINALMATERQKLTTWVETMTELGLDVVLIEGSAARHTQEVLLEAGVSLVTGVKPELLRRIAQCVGSTVRPVGSALSYDYIGSCQVFEVFQPPHAGSDQLKDGGSAIIGAAAADAAVLVVEPTPVMFFKGCGRGVGASIVLQGQNEDELIKVKRVAENTAYAALWNSLEAAFLADQLVAAATAAPVVLPDDGGDAVARQMARESASKVEELRAGGLITSVSPHCSTFGGEKEVEMEGGDKVTLNGLSKGQQELWLSILCKNPAKGTQCEPPHLHSMQFYMEGDLPLAEFVSAAAPTSARCPQCGDGAALHLRSFYHGDSLVTLSSVHLSPEKELPGAAESKVWLWLRRFGRNKDTTTATSGDGNENPPANDARRLLVGSDAACISFAHVLSLLLDARHLSLAGLSLQHDFVRYVGLGRTIICLHHSRIKPYNVLLPPIKVHVAEEDTRRWLVEEVKALTEEADEVFDFLLKAVEGCENLGTVTGNCAATLADVRSTLMKMLRSISTDSFASVHTVNAAVHSINKVQRHLTTLAQQWDAAIQSTDVGVKTLQQIPEVQQLQEASSSAALPQPPHSRTSSATSSVYGQPSTATVLSSSVRPLQSSSSLQSYMAPKLVDEPDQTTTASDHVEKEDRLFRVGLVARYVSKFEQEQPPASDERAEFDENVPVPAKKGPSTAITVTTNLGSGLRRTITIDDEVDEVFEQKLERLTEFFSQLVIPPSVSPPTGGMTTDRREKELRLPSHLVQSLLPGRAMLLDATQAPRTVYDREPTSIVAFFLSTSQYGKYVVDAREKCLNAAEDDVPPPLSTAEAGEDNPEYSINERVLRASLQLDCQMIAEDDSTVASHRAKFQMTAYYAPHFAALRELCVEGGEERYLSSLGRCVPWTAQGGKSNVFFAKTSDDRYIIKQLKKAEKQSVLEYAPDYFKYLQSSLAGGGKSCLAKIFGIYQVQIEYASGRLPITGKDGVLDFIVMENLFHDTDIQAIYDLKGSERDRYVADAVKQPTPAVLLDDNLRELNRSTPTLTTPSAYKRIQQSLFDDTNFLASLGVMDYSLLVGFSKSRHELIVGLVDYVRQYSWDKQVESWVKKSGLLGGSGKEPTIISPQQYARRFRTAMLSYFTVVPCLGKPADII